ncbi:hypothetical protein WG904_17575 [Pedobacter sp. Du54]
MNTTKGRSPPIAPTAHAPQQGASHQPAGYYLQIIYQSFKNRNNGN